MSTQNLISQKSALSFITGGNALFTVVLPNGRRFTYKVLNNHADNSFFNVSYLYGPDNTVNYKKFGYIRVTDGVPLFHKQSVHDVAEVFDTLFLNLTVGLETPGIQIFHSGRCCRCGRVLTVPESIVSGVGPECAFKVSILKSLLA